MIRERRPGANAQDGLSLPPEVGLPGHHDEGCREARGVVRRGSWAARTISAVALSSTDGDVLAVEPVIGRLVHREGCRHHYLGQSGISALLECLDEKYSQFRRRRQGAKARRGLSSGTTQTRRAW